MRTLILVMLITLPMLAHASDAYPPQDRIVFENGKRVVLRTTKWPSSDGGSISIEQKFIVNAEGNLSYYYHQQSPQTQAYHQALCAEDGLSPPTGGELIFSDNSAGWSCVHVIEFQPGEELPPDPTADGMGDDARAVDYVYVTAPGGTVPVGINFLARGIARAQSSVPGSFQGKVEVDNGRCFAYYSQHYANPFLVTHEARVNCIVHESRFVDTRMDGCIPKLCGYGNGTLWAGSRAKP